jgi:signal transduction histidine kinase
MGTRVTDRRPPSHAENARPAGGRSGPKQRKTGPASAPTPTLLGAAQRVLKESVGAPGNADDWVAAADELASLTLAVQATAATGEPQLAKKGTQLSRHLLDRLEDAVVREEVDAAAVSTPTSLDGVVAALAQVRQALEADGAGEIEADLSGPNGLELVSEIAHDLRSPLTSILTLAEVLRSGQSGEVSEVQRRQLGLIYSAALALSATASDFIELTHGGDRLAQKEPSPFSVSEILESVRDIVYPLAEEKRLSLRIESGIRERRQGYPLALSRVLLNLTTNALKFTEQGFVEIAARPSGPLHAEFSVRDTGNGIDQSALPTLFQPFHRASGPRCYCFSGTGLGLAICQRLVEAMGSELQFETRPGWGTRFHFRLEIPPADLPI